MTTTKSQHDCKNNHKAEFLKANSAVPLILALALTACGNDSKQSAVISRVATPVVNAVSDPSATVIANPLPNSYSVHLNWGLLVEAKAVAIKRFDGKEQKIFDPLPGEATDFTDTAVPPGGTYLYEISSLKEATPQVEYALKVVVPKDLNVEAGKSKSIENGIFNRVFLGPDSHLVSNGQNVTLVAEEFHADNSFIETFPSNQTALPEIQGRSGGVIIIRSTKATGHLTLVARGEQGGAGRLGTAGTPGTRGSKGRAATTKQQLINNGHDHDSEDFHYKIICDQSPENGAQGNAGAPGAPGTPGGNGMSGGDAGKILLSVKSDKGFTIDTEYYVGRGGLAGVGGSGGPGGAGGDPGDSQGVCPTAKAGMAGPTGPNGPTGQTGMNGGNASICLQLNGVTLGDCLWAVSELQR